MNQTEKYEQEKRATTTNSKPHNKIIWISLHLQDGYIQRN